MVKVSIIVPIYNVENYLRECLDSLINQTLKEIEIICIDDCSTDNSYFILEEYAEKDNRIKLIKNENNRGVGYSRNVGQRSALGEYLYFIDPDDYISYNFLESMYNTAKKYDSDIVNTNHFYYVFEPGKKIELFYACYNINTKSDYVCDISFDNFQSKDNSYKVYFTLWTKLFKKNFLIDNNIYSPENNIGFAYDAIVVFNALMYSAKYSFNNNAIYYYRRRSDSIMSEKTFKEDKILNTISNYNSIIAKYNKETPELVGYLNIHILASIMYIMDDMSFEMNLRYFDYIRNFIRGIFIEEKYCSNKEFYNNIHNRYILIRSSINYDDYCYRKLNFNEVKLLSSIESKLEYERRWIKLFAFNNYGKYLTIIIFGIKIAIKKKS